MVTEKRWEIIFRWRWITHCLQWAGATAFEGPDYAYLVGPLNKPDPTDSMQKMWGCGLVVRGLLRTFGIEHPRLGPYRIEAAFADIVSVATDANAFKNAPLVPTTGNIVAFGRGEKAHVSIVLGHWRDDGVLWTLDGGQKTSKGHQTILFRQRQPKIANEKVHSIDGLDVIWWVPIPQLRILQTAYLDTYQRTTPILPSPTRFSFHNRNQ